MRRVLEDPIVRKHSTHPRYMDIPLSLCSVLNYLRWNHYVYIGENEAVIKRYRNNKSPNIIYIDDSEYESESNSKETLAESVQNLEEDPKYSTFQVHRFLIDIRDTID
jgi:hypothetical protein